ncbi:MAG: DUF4959 domain-containing protein [Bacteroidales bacterium]|nr:DUF4959 domain-containing protein [Bacteroidales bacterium]
MKNHHYHLFITIIVILITGACKEDSLDEHLDSNAPAPVAIDKSSITHRDFAGGSVLYYKLPKDDNLLYVRAEYESAPGVVREATASLFIDSLVLEGFNESRAYDISIYSVGKNEKSSESVVYQVTPGIPPVLTAFESLTLETAFGGVRGGFQNDAETPLTVVLSADTTFTGNFIQLRSFTLSEIRSTFTYLDMDSVETTFNIYMKDRWGNRTESKQFVLKPLFEEEIPKPWSAYALPSDWIDAAEGNANYGFTNLWDGVYSQRNANIFASSHTGPAFPYTCTFTLGREAIISRMVMHHRLNFEYVGKTPKKIELWGSDSDDPGDDLLLSGDWFCLGKFESKMPSGGNSPTDEDKVYGNGEGEQFMVVPNDEIPNPYRPVKFLRIRPQEVWDGTKGGQIIIAEIDLYGQLVK